MSVIPPFIPHPWLTNPHAMTLLPWCWPRRRIVDGLPIEHRLFAVAPDSKVLGLCHWQTDRTDSPVVIVVHGLEGSADSSYMRGIASKAWKAGFHVVRLNQRNCGGTEHLTPSLYHGGLTHDLHCVMKELLARDGLDAVCVVGYSLGGNVVLNMAGELGRDLPALRGVVAVSPNIDPAACVTALEERRNWIYHQYFVTSLKRRVRRKAQHFPGVFDLAQLASVRTMREFDNRFTAPFGGFSSAADYYERTGACHVVGKIQVPCLIITAQDDPFIPVTIFNQRTLRNNPWIRLVVPSHGGHCGFIQRTRADEDCYWAENRIIDFLKQRVTDETIGKGFIPSHASFSS